MDDNQEDPLKEKIKYCQEIARYLKEEFQSLLQKPKSTDTSDDSDHSVKQTPISKDVTKHLLDIDFALESIQQQFKLTLEKYLSTQSDLDTSADRSSIQSDANQMQVAKILINQQINLSKDSNCQNEDKLNPTVQALFNGTLPDDFYLHLISVMGIQDCLISNRLVCSFWNELVLDRCHNQKSLKLFENFYCLIDYGELLLNYEKTDDTSLILKSIGDDLLFEGLEIDHKELVKSLNSNVILTRERKLEASKVLTDLFSKIEELVLCPETDSLINIEHLLQFYAPQLTSLTMTLFGPCNESPDSKLGAFRSFPKLKSLNTFRFSPEEDQLLSLLPQLESLTLSRTEISLETLLRTGTQLRELNINCVCSVFTAPEDAFSKRQPLYSHLRKFSVGYIDYVSEALEFISLNLTSLECLKLYFRCYPDNLHLLTSNLVPLRQLHSLTLQASVSVFLLDDSQLAQIKPLPSVRQLKLLLCDYEPLPLGSLSLKSMDLFSRSLFTTFPNVEQALIGFVGNEGGEYLDDGHVDADTLAAFQDFAGKHPNIVQLFRSRNLSTFTKLPNAVSPLLGHRRQVYEEYSEEEELFGVAIGRLTASLDPRQGEDGPNLKAALRPADRLTALSNLLQLLERKAFTLTFEMVNVMIENMVECALKYDPSQGTLFSVTCQCVLALLDCRVVDYNEGDKSAFLDSKHLKVFSFLEKMLKLVKHYETKQLDDKELLLQICKRMVKILKFDSIRDEEQFDEFKLFKILLKLANHYQTQQLSVLDNEEKVLLQIDNLIDDQLQKFECEKRLDSVIRKLIRSQNRVYRVEMACALTRCGKSGVSYFKLLSDEADSDSSDGDSNDSSSSESEPEM